MKYSSCETHISLVTGDYPCLNVVFHFKRESGFYVLQMIISSWLIVIVSWFSFFLSREAIAARTSLGVTTVLSMATLLMSTGGANMRVSYARALDIWFSVCMTAVFLSLLEFILVNAVDRREKKKYERIANDAKPSACQKIDKAARVVLPSCFVVFNIAFWVHFISQPFEPEKNLSLDGPTVCD